jgi:hypothetical protein
MIPHRLRAKRTCQESLHSDKIRPSEHGEALFLFTLFMHQADLNFPAPLSLLVGTNPQGEKGFMLAAFDR